MKNFSRLQNIFFDYEEEKRAKVRDEKLKLSSYKFLSNRISSVANTSVFSKQVMIKLLSNLSSKGVKNALSYIIRNSESDFAMNQDNEFVSLQDIMSDWSKDFSDKCNAKEAWHFTFSLDEEVSERNIKALQKSVNEVMRKNFFEYKYVSVIHSHQSKPHIHIILNKNNIFTRKKLHFDNKQDIRDFWNMLREDFKNSLNFYNPHFNYSNKYKFERDLLQVGASEQIQTPFNIKEEISKSLLALHKKAELYERKYQALHKEVSLLVDKKKKLIDEAKILMASNNKRYFQVFKAIKAINKELANIKISRLEYKNNIDSLNARSKELHLERLNYGNGYENLAKKQAYLHFLESKISKKDYSKSDICLLQRIKSDLVLNAKSLTQDVEQDIQIDLLFAKKLHRKSNASHLISLAKNINRHLNALQHINISEELSDRLKNYKEILQKNNQIIIGLCQQKAQNLHQLLLKGERSPYKQQELNTLNIFLNKPLGDFGILLQKQKTESATQKLSQPIKQTSLENLQIDEFLQWYAKRQDIRNIALYEASLKEKINNNTFENFKQLYKEFEHRAKGINR